MIDLLIYHLHIVGIIYAFVKRWQAEGVKSGLLAVGLIALAFTILWALMGPLARLLMPGQAAPSAIFTADTLSLVLTLAAEIPLYLAFFHTTFGQNQIPS